MGARFLPSLRLRRRLAPAPLVSNENGIPAMSVNVNQLPMQGLSRIEVLRDGASSVYGSDAIAGVINVQLKKKAGARYTAQDLAREIAAIQPPAAWPWTGPFDMLVTGVGGTGVVTVGALVTMAAHLEGKQASVLDFMGFAQKGGAVLSFVRVAPTLDLLNQVRIDSQQADVLLACDMVVGASPDALGTVKAGRTVILANTHELPTAGFVRNPDASLQGDSLLAKMKFAVGEQGELATIDAQDIAQRLMGDTLPSNIVMLGACWQRGLVPVSACSSASSVQMPTMIARPVKVVRRPTGSATAAATSHRNGR